MKNKIFNVFVILFLFQNSCNQKDTSQHLEEQPQMIKLERFRKALWTVPVTIQGKEGDFLLDTGGGITMLSEAFSKQIDCQFWGRTTGFNMFGSRGDGTHCDSIKINIGKIILTPTNVGTINFGDRFSGDKTPDGILSLDAFDGKAITLDQKTKTIFIETPSSLAIRTKDMKEFPMRVSRECSGRCLSIFIGVITPQGMTWLLLDSGAGGVSLISNEYAQVFGLDPDLKEQQLKFNLANDIKIESPVILADMIMDGNLGQPFMSKYKITIDIVNSRLWLSKSQD